MYSPRTPIKNSWTEEKKKTLIIIGASPNGNMGQKISLAIRYPIAIAKLKNDIIKPEKAATLSGILEWLVIPRIAVSYKSKKL